MCAFHNMQHFISLFGFVGHDTSQTQEVNPDEIYGAHNFPAKWKYGPTGERVIHVVIKHFIEIE